MDLGFSPLHLDIETSGSTPGKHQILTIATLDFITGETHHWELRHSEVIAVPAAMEVNQISLAELDSSDRLNPDLVDDELAGYLQDFSPRALPIGRAVANFDMAMIKASMPVTAEVLGFAHMELNSLIYLESLKRQVAYPIMKSQLMRQGKVYAGKKTGLEEHHALFDVHLDAHILSTLTGIIPEWMAI